MFLPHPRFFVLYVTRSLVPLRASLRSRPTRSPLTHSCSHSVSLPPISGSLCASLSYLKEVLPLKLTREPNGRDQQRPADLFLAAVEVLFTFWVAYPAVVALAKVLLQTAPDRGMPSGQMEALLRVMREVCTISHTPMLNTLTLAHLIRSNGTQMSSTCPHRTSGNSQHLHIPAYSCSSRVQKKSTNVINVMITPTCTLILTRLRQTATQMTSTDVQLGA